MKALAVIASVLVSMSCNAQGGGAYSTPHDYNSKTLYTPDFKLIERALDSKQRLYNERVSMLNMKYQNIVNIAERVKSKQGSFTPEQLKYLQWFDAESQKTRSYDLTVTANYQNIMNWLSGIETELYTWL